ncbi:MFS general substrate transporter [Dothidotthia symphoricarpi CBS 119687]|uniref:MFS general substrate transporter n=1 Tax=Dothidotthia symphoricarpi CBS 119687 TaxID=1392245 RepID=A0A6A6A615_9PLEO|nr:MFS general substrate transporter [Dothidotthia symphoricarpi CBS 119687]KAF2126051.1 MFS general substrate transporter [Dothidotthia symphoricarpi CBS 119687]
MASNTDVPSVEDIYVDQGLRSGPNAQKTNSKAPIRVYEEPNIYGANSSGLDSNQENVPLLSPTRSDSGNTNGDDSGNGETEWTFDKEFQGLPWWKQPSIFWLLPPFLLFTIAFGGVIVPKINLIMDLVCEEYYASQGPNPASGPMDPGQQSDRCRNDDVSSRSSLFLLYGSLCAGILAAVTSPKLCALSDRYGRKNFMIFNTCTALFGEVLTILAAKYPDVVHVNWILVGYAFEGLGGSFIVGMALAHSYASDCVSPQKRSTAFSYFYACLFAGIAIGPVVAGYIIEARTKSVGKTEARLLIFYLALAAHGMFIFFLSFCIPESLSKSRQAAAREKHEEEMERLGPASDWINQLRHVNLFAPLKILWPTGPGTSSAVRRNLVLLAAIDTIVFSVAMGGMGVVLVYTRRQFGWQDVETGHFVTIVNGARVLGLIVLLPLITRIVRGKTPPRQRSSGCDNFDLSIVRFAILLDMCGYLGYTLARKGEFFALSGALAAVGGIGSPALSAALTKHVPQDKVGQLLGATGLLHALARIIGPTVFNGIYSATVSLFRQTVFVSLTATFGLAFVCSWFVRPHVYINDKEPEDQDSLEQNA